MEVSPFFWNQSEVRPFGRAILAQTLNFVYCSIKVGHLVHMIEVHLKQSYIWTIKKTSLKYLLDRFHNVALKCQIKHKIWLIISKLCLIVFALKCKNASSLLYFFIVHCRYFIREPHLELTQRVTKKVFQFDNMRWDSDNTDDLISMLRLWLSVHWLYCYLNMLQVFQSWRVILEVFYFKMC